MRRILLYSSSEVRVLDCGMQYVKFVSSRKLHPVERNLSISGHYVPKSFAVTAVPNQIYTIPNCRGDFGVRNLQMGPPVLRSYPVS